MPKVLVQNEALEFEVESNTNLLKALRQNGHSPYGMFSRFLPFLFRGADDVLVIEGKKNLTPPTDRERSILGQKIDNNVRLASEASVTGDVEIHTAARIKI
ncbi:MAG: hypothetical protein IT462_03080 [Planctomycetes bacterium]|nr:hypothetical protein [Planctomycetota bacterium]